MSVLAAPAIVREVAAEVGLAEGERGVRSVLAALVRLEPVSTRGLSRTVDLPVPIVASICGELRKREIVSSERPAQLTDARPRALRRRQARAAAFSQVRQVLGARRGRALRHRCGARRAEPDRA